MKLEMVGKWRINVNARHSPEPKQTDGQQHTPQHCRPETFFRRQGREVSRGTPLQRFLPIRQPIHDDEDRRGEDDSRAYAQKHQPGLALVEVVDANLGHGVLENQRERREEAKQDTKVEGHVDAQERDDALCDEHVQRSRDRDEEDEPPLRHAGRQRVRRARDAELLRASFQDDALIRLLLRDAHGVADCAGEEDHPLRPSPGPFHRDVPPDGGAEGRTQERGDEEHGARDRSVKVHKEIAVGACAHGQTARAQNAREETTDDEAGEAVGEPGAQCEEQRRWEEKQVHRAATVRFAQRGAHDRPESETQDIDGQGNNGGGARYIEVCRDFRGAC